MTINSSSAWPRGKCQNEAPKMLPWESGDRRPVSPQTLKSCADLERSLEMKSEGSDRSQIIHSIHASKSTVLLSLRSSWRPTAYTPFPSRAESGAPGLALPPFAHRVAHLHTRWPLSSAGTRHPAGTVCKQHTHRENRPGERQKRSLPAPPPTRTESAVFSLFKFTFM